MKMNKKQKITIGIIILLIVIVAIGFFYFSNTQGLAGSEKQGPTANVEGSAGI